MIMDYFLGKEKIRHMKVDADVKIGVFDRGCCLVIGNSTQLLGNSVRCIIETPCFKQRGLSLEGVKHLWWFVFVVNRHNLELPERRASVE